MKIDIVSTAERVDMESRFPRSSGILLHPTSLPGPWGIGDLGTAAYQFIDFLADAGQTLWQILPLVPVGFGNSPYQSPSAFAGSPLLISPERLVEEGLLSHEDLERTPRDDFEDDRVNYDAVVRSKQALLLRSFRHFQRSGSQQHKEAFARFNNEHARWLDTYAFFMAIKEKHGEMCWSDWEPGIARRQPAALQQWRSELAEEIEQQKYWQYLFYSQWGALKAYANSHNVRIVGDAPIFVSYDSADVWANSDLFFLDSAGKPTVVAGVPPDYFSATGQLWGNPLYRWDIMANNGFEWWIHRIKHALSQVDILRLDHFRGFESYWEVPATEETAINGRWVKAPGRELFQAINRELGTLPIIAEDLGIITKEVAQLRDEFHLPGMKILHFAFGGGGAENPYLPHNYVNNCVVYTGTHDNDTTLGWFQSREDYEREAVQCYLGRDGSDICWELMRLALMSVADICIVPLQDILRLDAEGRMNIPGTAEGNWEWRVRADMLNPGIAEGMRLLTTTYGRLPESKS